MLATLGTTCLILLLPSALYSMGAMLIGVRQWDARLYRSGLLSAYATCLLLTLAVGLLVAAFVGDHFDIVYVQEHSNRALPLFYKVAGLWAGLDGSLLFWAWMLSVLGVMALVQLHDRLPRHLPAMNAVLMGILLFFGVLLLFTTNPFSAVLAAPFDGKGLNPLLQAPEMVIHPPMLYLGYVSASIPFAIAMAGLLMRETDEAWLDVLRGWVLLCWFFLSVGNLLGMYWAYVELGWGGFWAWDPVENAAALPWFTATALLHSIIVQQRRGMLRMWNITLTTLTFLLTIFGTFLTRSGVVQSVHAFSNSTLGYFFGGFLLVCTLCSFGLIWQRRHTLISRHALDTVWSKEGSFLLNNFLLTLACAAVLCGTMLPTMAEWLTGSRVAVGPQYFNTMMAPFGIALLVLAGFGPIVAWRRAEPRAVFATVRLPLLCALLAMAVAWVAEIRMLIVLGMIGAGTFALLVTLGEFARGLAVVRRTQGVPWVAAPVALARRAHRRYGGYLVHVGMIAMFAAFTATAYQQEENVHLREGEKITLRGYTVTFDGLRYRADDNMEAIAAELAVTRGGAPVAQLFPARHFYRASEQHTSEVSLYHGWFGDDLYTVLGAFDVDTHSAEIKIVHNPLVNLLWLGGLMLVAGTTVIIWPWKPQQATGRQDRVAQGGIPS